MTAFTIDFTAERRARIEEANTARAREQLRAVAGHAIDHILDGLPGAAEARAICDRAMGDPLPETLTEEFILATTMEDFEND
ncbi:MAG: hypothetical protein GYB49_09370 [Alphaproteobacteria bacterium]|nr:hypothetical protein [Hyphomonas sp.]MBR9807418.1 hypothetical protein [Alphaproteobacteria bacterium]